MSRSLALALFRAYQDNLRESIGAPRPPTSIPCPLCLVNSISESAIVAGHPLEHVVPESVTAMGRQRTPHSRIGDKSSRSGLTLTCEACNRFKGSRLDAPFRRAFAYGAAPSESIPVRTAILTYAYLFAFAVFGYSYAVDQSLADIRRQFREPHHQVTPWLDSVVPSVQAWHHPIVLNSWGYPFMLAEGAPIGLLVSFWRCAAQLPPRKSGPVVSIPPEILSKANTVA